MKRSMRFFLILTIAVIRPADAAPESRATTFRAAGSYETGMYQDLFTSVCSKSKTEVERKITAAFNQLFHGDTATQSVYYPVGTDMAYIEDILHSDVRTEGMSYGMMIAVQMDKKEEFDRLWKWAKTYMQHQNGIHRNFFAWHCAPDGSKLDQNAASDGEEWFVTALFFAAARWGNGHGIFDYNAEAQAILRTMLHKEEEPGGSGTVTNMFNRQERQVVFVPSVEAAGFTDPSYHLPHFYELWARWAGQDNGFWASCAHVSREFWKKAAHPATGLSPEYAHFDGRPIAPWDSGSMDFRYDAWRVAMNIAMDHEWFGKDPWQVEQSNRLLTFFSRHGVGTYGTLFRLEGTPISNDRSTGLVAMNAVACLASTLPVRKAFLDELWNTPIPSGPGRYYDGLLYMLSLLQSSGNFRIYDPMKTPRPTAPSRTVTPLKTHETDARASYISTHKGAFALSALGRPAPLVVSSMDFPGVRRVLSHLQTDLMNVTGTKPALMVDSLPRSSALVIAGTIGRSPLIDSLIRSGKLRVDAVAGRWESFQIEVIDRPFPTIDKALVIAGSDKRGTVYGIYDVSKRIGVSPWHWWSDVPAAKQRSLFVKAGCFVQPEPSVRYRGIFINDEAPNLSGFAQEKFGGFNSRFYDHVFDLILRLKGNYLWPAMWGRSLFADDTLSAPLADEYGVVLGTSHHEPMVRSHVEWSQPPKGPWSYEKNDSTLREFWRDGIRRMGTHETIVTVGMRGDGDEPMSQDANIALLERIVKDQRAIISEVTHKDAATVPQLWALYKEVQEYYDKGMRVPDDVTLLLCDDNWGNIRKLPRLTDAPRAGGYGIYYHFDYVGGPRNYKWVNTNQVSRIWEQMHLAYEYGARQIWIVNVGDIKPMELPTEFFLDYAWDPGGITADKLPDYARQWAAAQFGPRHARGIGEILTGYTTYNSRRKPELLSPATFSLVNYREAETVLADYQALTAKAQKISDALPASMRDAYYQLVLHPVIACSNLYELYVTTGRNHLYATQRRASTNTMAAHARALFAKDSAISYYYNHTMANGKWDHMMDQTHIGYTSWQQPEADTMPAVRTITIPDASELGVSIEGSTASWPGDSAAAVLPAFDPLTPASAWIEIFNRGRHSFDYIVTPGKSWVRVSMRKGIITNDQRITVSVDWKRVPVGVHTVPITITGPKAQTVTVFAVVNNMIPPSIRAQQGYAEHRNYVSIEAGHYTRAVSTPSIGWLTIPSIGRTLSGVTPVPVTSPAQTPGGIAQPYLEYTVLLTTPGTVKVRTYVSPTLNFHNTPGLRYGVSIDDAAPQIVNIHDAPPEMWNQWVSDNVIVSSSDHAIRTAGTHVIKYWMVDPAIVLQKLVVETGAVKPSYLGPPESVLHKGRQAASVARADDRFFNPILAGFYPDPSICRVGTEYYLVTSTFAYFPGIPIFHSRDLAHWEQLGNVLDRPEQLNLDGHGVSRGLFAPAIRYHDGMFYVTCTLVDNGGNFIVTARDPRGPWSAPVFLPEVRGIDPSPFFDANGKAYIVYNSDPPNNISLYNGHRTIRMVEFDPKTLKVTSTDSILVNGGTDIAKQPIWIEGPHIYQKDGAYFLMAAEGGTADWHSEVVFKSANVYGPYVPYDKNPILTQRHLDPSRTDPITCTGHADLVETPSGQWYAVFLGCRPYELIGKDEYTNTGRETFMAPVSWSMGWPVINPDFAEVQYSYPLPAGAATAKKPGAFSGNLHFRDEFTARVLGSRWMLLRTPRSMWYTLSSPKGRLSLQLRPEQCDDAVQPSFVAFRQQNLKGAATTSVTCAPKSENEKAGLAIFQNESHYYYLCLSNDRNATVVQLYKASGKHGDKTMELLASEKLAENVITTPVQLKIEARGTAYAFSYAQTPGEWTIVKDSVDARFLSTRVAGGFVGALYALYATSLGQPSTTTAQFDWFDYRGADDLFK